MKLAISILACSSLLIANVAQAVIFKNSTSRIMIVTGPGDPYTERTVRIESKSEKDFGSTANQTIRKTFDICVPLKDDYQMCGNPKAKISCPLNVGPIIEVKEGSEGQPIATGCSTK